MGAGSSIFTIVVSPTLIAISIICSCSRQLKISPLIANKIKMTAKSANSTNDKISELSVESTGFKISSNGNCGKCITNRKIPFNIMKNNIKQKISDMEALEIKPKLPKKRKEQSWENTNDLQMTKSCKKLDSSHLTEQMMGTITADHSNENELIISALMTNGIIIFPRQLEWNLRNTAQQIKLQNLTKNRFAIKVKCTDNKLYRIKPVFAFIEPKSSILFDISRYDGIASINRILFLTTQATKNDNDPHKLFTDCGTNKNLCELHSK